MTLKEAVQSSLMQGNDYFGETVTKVIPEEGGKLRITFKEGEGTTGGYFKFVDDKLYVRQNGVTALWKEVSKISDEELKDFRTYADV